jgi:O-acetylhomoserine/O-acetylserine sulfhydrylase-like pyridoxal-dependent enzyme
MTNALPDLGFATRAIHHDYDPLQYKGALNPPVFLTSTYAFDKTDTGTDRFAGKTDGFVYSRVGNPTVAILESRLAALEHGEAALATSSGVGALTAVIWTVLKSGDEIIADKMLYGCTFGLFEHHIGRFGIKVTFVDLTDANRLKEALNSKTRIVSPKRQPIPICG